MTIDPAEWEAVCVEQMASLPDWWHELAARADERHGPGGLLVVIDGLSDLNDARRPASEVCLLALMIYGAIGAADEWDQTDLIWPRQSLSLKQELVRMARNLSQGHGAACAWARASCRLRAFLCEVAEPSALEIEQPGRGEPCQMCAAVGINVPDLPAINLHALRVTVAIASWADALDRKVGSQHLDRLVEAIFTAFQALTGSRSNWLITSNPARSRQRQFSGRGYELCKRLGERFDLPIVTSGSANRLEKVRRRR